MTAATWPTGGSAASTTWKYQGRLDLSPTTTSLYDFAAREYAPGLGTFTSLDSVLGSAQNPGQLNRFLYAAANPATLVDPDGHAIIDQEGTGAAIVNTIVRATSTAGRGTNNSAYNRAQAAAEYRAANHRVGSAASASARVPGGGPVKGPLTSGCVSTGDCLTPTVSMPPPADITSAWGVCGLVPDDSSASAMACMQSHLGKQAGVVAFLQQYDGRFDKGPLDWALSLATWAVAAHGAGPAPALQAVDPLEFAADSVVPAGKVQYLLGQITEGPSAARSAGKGGLFADILAFDNATLPKALLEHLKAGIGTMSDIKLNAQGEWQFNVTGPMTGPSGLTELIVAGWKLTPDGVLSIVTAVRE